MIQQLEFVARDTLAVSQPGFRFHAEHTLSEATLSAYKLTGFVRGAQKHSARLMSVLATERWRKRRALPKTAQKWYGRA